MYLGALASVQCPGIPALPRQGPEGIIERSASYGKLEQLFFGFSNRATGGPVKKQGIYRWLVDAITQAYSSLGLQCPIGVRANSTRGIASS